MAIIKSKSATALLTRSSVIDLGDLSRQSNRILEEAQSQASQIIKEAKEEADQLIEGASEKGYAEGKKQGVLAGHEEGLDTGRQEALSQFVPQLEELKTSFSSAIEHWENERHRMYLEAREDVLEFALTMAKKITHRIVQTDPSIAGDQIIEALALLAEPTSVVVSVSPLDRQTIEKMLPDIVQQIANCTHIELQDDPALTQGGCLIKTRQGSINATIERQIERIVESLCPGDVVEIPDNAKEEPEDAVAEPEDVVEIPDDVVTEMEDVVEEPEDIVEKPDDDVQESDGELMGE